MTPEDFAQKTILNLPGEQNVALSAGLMLLITEIAIGLIPIIRDRCRKSSSEVVCMAQNPTWLEKRALARRVRREMGFREFRLHGGKVVDAIIRTGSEATTEEVAALLESI